MLKVVEAVAPVVDEFAATTLTAAEIEPAKLKQIANKKSLICNFTSAHTWVDLASHSMRWAIRQNRSEMPLLGPVDG
ncbi:hypothetical protein [Rhodoferax sp. GW822-FHT02A01]|uniref:hypothetical protein n=1 Tax=Rhodoferax sp. GW822-FHT02A01 TaxID=3141537 RepID=UPI00315CC0CE